MEVRVVVAAAVVVAEVGSIANTLFSLIFNFANIGRILLKSWVNIGRELRYNT